MFSVLHLKLAVAENFLVLASVGLCAAITCSVLFFFTSFAVDCVNGDSVKTRWKDLSLIVQEGRGAPS